MTEQTKQAEERKLPEVLHLRYEEGTKGYIKQEGWLDNALKEGKIERDAVYQLGRSIDEFSRYVVEADGEPVAYLTRDNANWTAHFLEGDKEVSQKTIKRSDSKKPRKAGSKMPVQIDNGPDLLTAVTHVAQELWPKVTATSNKRGSGGGKLREKLDNAMKEMAHMLKELADLTDKSVDQVAEEKGYELTDEMKAYIATLEETAKDSGKKPAKGK